MFREHLTAGSNLDAFCRLSRFSKQRAAPRSSGPLSQMMRHGRNFAVHFETPSLCCLSRRGRVLAETDVSAAQEILDEVNAILHLGKNQARGDVHVLASINWVGRGWI